MIGICNSDSIFIIFLTGSTLEYTYTNDLIISLYVNNVVAYNSTYNIGRNSINVFEN